MGRIAGWAVDRGYQKILVNEDAMKPNAITLIHLPNILRADVNRTLATHIGYARSTTYTPELVAGRINQTEAGFISIDRSPWNGARPDAPHVKQILKIGGGTRNCTHGELSLTAHLHY
ncbi:hypothetical protein BDM02DRAFT_3002538 [Thelephora ganbajun]|uniref:Uncharacterized protein n=1 Tax=Thelephora ganbajun TaxID=370292 RepID=A0ACB6ZA08_THEGA|nr:hypothetical protein BDM02DRAFT_3002538 [Thelephora ganbajun]